ncbi:MAG: L-threonylcarbamoyladenylate synthase [Alphaproteobacteria bacterium]|jgi:L-threonylcarbamoyladenylate synthase
MQSADNLRAADEGALKDAARLLHQGALVAFPTETVYGLGADATNDQAVATIFAAKGRPSFNPLIVHFASIEAAKRHAQFNDMALALAAAFWPGPLTLVLNRKEDSPISRLVSAGLNTLAVRVPAHPIARALLAEANLPIAAPSANRSGSISPTTAAHVAESLNNGPILILDGGPCPVGIESTVLDLSQAPPTLLRPGGIPTEAIIPITGPLAVAPDEDDDTIARRSPGRLARHYAPCTKIRLNATEVYAGEALLAFGPHLPVGADCAAQVLNLSVRGDTTEAAANLFAMLHRLDALGASAIACAPVPLSGLGTAINDRLARAAAPLPLAEAPD